MQAILSMHLILEKVGHVYRSRTSLPVKKYENIEKNGGESWKGIGDVWVSKYKQVNSNPLLLELCTNTQTQTQTALHIWRECYKPIVIVGKKCIC